MFLIRKGDAMPSKVRCKKFKKTLPLTFN